MESVVVPPIDQFLRELNLWIEIRERLSMIGSEKLNPVLDKVDTIIINLISGVVIGKPPQQGEPK